MSFEYTRSIPVEETYDLVVAGGGPAGSAAAICAGRLGAKVMLIEAMGCLGGMGTCGLVNAFDPMANGKEMLVGGLMREIVEEMYSRNYLVPGIDPDIWRKIFEWTPFQGEGYKIILEEYAQKANVEIRYFTKAVDVDMDESGKVVKGVVLHNIEGFSYIPAKTFVDATGDAVLSKLAGVTCREAGKDSPHIMPATLPSIYANVNFQEYCSHRSDVDTTAMIEEEYRLGNLTQCDRLLPGLSMVGKSTAYLNGGHVFNLDATKCKDLTNGMIQGRKIAQEYLKMYRKRFKGCENAELVQTGWLMGIRESRRILGEYEMTLEDFKARRKFPDQIGVFSKYVDVHPYDCSNEEWNRFNREAKGSLMLEKGEYFGIPYGILVPKGYHNLWVAGRCTSTDVEVQGSIRVMPSSAMMGQAAGTAAVQSIRTGETADTLNTKTLVLTLRENGAYLPQTELSETMTR